MLHLLVAFAFAMVACTAAAAPNQDEAVSAQARAVFERSRDSIAQIRVLLGKSESHTSTGSGFVIAAGGVMLTNYHVVAEKALEPDTYRLEFVLPNGRRGALRILAIDVRHDLAVVQGDVGDVKPLTFRQSELSKGDRGFSTGYPLDQGLTVTEGTYNGRSEEQYYEHFHFTGALNAGMSGGPALDSAGRVFGVNVASHFRGQLVNFLVPAKYAQQLLKKAAAPGAADLDFKKDVGAQLRAHGEELMGEVLKKPFAVDKLGEFSLPGKLDEFMRCGASTQRETGRLYTIDSYSCHTVSSIYIDPRLHTGTISFGHAILDGSRLGAIRFAHLQESRFAAGGGGGGYDRKHHTRFRCHDRIVALKGTRAKVALCTRGYKRFEGLYDVIVKIATVGSSERALHSRLEIEGVAFEAATTFVRRYLETLEWSR